MKKCIYKILFIVGVITSIHAEDFNNTYEKLSPETAAPINKNIELIDIIKDSEKNHESALQLTNREMDQIFISFTKEREEEKKAKEEKKRKEKPSFVSGNISGSPLPPVYPRDMNNPQTFGDKGEVKNTKVEEEEAEETIEYALATLKINGILCDNGRCIAFTNMGVVKSGDVLNPDENVTRITGKYVKTNKQKIEF